MAALAYVLLPVTGLVAYFSGDSHRARWHGLQAIALGTLWPALLYISAALGDALVAPVFLAGLVVWLVFLVGAAAGRDPTIPWMGGRLKELAKDEL